MASSKLRLLARREYDGEVSNVIADLHESAIGRTKLCDFGDGRYRKGLAVLLEAFGPLDDRDWTAIREDLITTLVCRLRTEAGWRQYPSYKNGSLREPLVICGLPRTGTTALHKLLSVDAQFQGLQHWLCEAPMPRPDRAAWESEPAFQEARQRLELRHSISPGMKLAHEVVADELDECLEVLRQEFVSNRFACSFNVPMYDEWFRKEDERFSYQRLSDVMRLIGLNSDRRWLLKNPGHHANLNALFDVFPDARVVVTSRDIVKSIGSLCSVLKASQARFNSVLNPLAIGPREIDYWGAAHKSAQSAMSKRPDQFFVLEHAELHANPIGVIQRIYAYFGLALSLQTKDCMERWLALNPAGKHGEHVYSLREFGLEEARVRQAFSLPEEEPSYVH